MYIPWWHLLELPGDAGTVTQCIKFGLLQNIIQHNHGNIFITTCAVLLVSERDRSFARQSLKVRNLKVMSRQIIDLTGDSDHAIDSQAQPQSQNWICNHCSFVNHAFLPYCETCNHPCQTAATSTPACSASGATGTTDQTSSSFRRSHPDTTSVEQRNEFDGNFGCGMREQWKADDVSSGGPSCYRPDVSLRHWFAHWFDRESSLGSE